MVFAARLQLDRVLLMHPAPRRLLTGKRKRSIIWRVNNGSLVLSKQEAKSLAQRFSSATSSTRAALVERVTAALVTRRASSPGRLGESEEAALEALRAQETADQTILDAIARDLGVQRQERATQDITVDAEGHESSEESVPGVEDDEPTFDDESLGESALEA